MFSKALLNATYKNGKPGQFTAEHERAEHHHFKSEYLFKNKRIPKDLYASRLIQQFLLIKAIETKLQRLANADKIEISAFFALSYLGQLWRTPAMEEDLRQLGVNPDEISRDKITETTEKYLGDIEKLTPKTLLAHFLVHVAGFMHGGYIVQSKYINPSNRLTAYQIPAKQYDFSSSIPFLSTGKRSSLGLYQDMMEHVDKIEINGDEYVEVFTQCKGIYATMASIYDNLCDMHAQQPTLSTRSIAVFGASIFVLALVIKLLADFLNPMTNHISRGPMTGP
ncbi:biliverdin-producing heme oxygenase [Legionella feeleii]|uniref:Heme oxygenase n=1 Tax=Legionella feeleii TaxID=453 RepID=A0A378IZ66_9GAMM|nr:biliverdin-producing heme oxygenase [Legionella feeleii]STX39771.1 heme oxygenase [Legionella feeleii]